MRLDAAWKWLRQLTETGLLALLLGMSGTALAQSLAAFTVTHQDCNSENLPDRGITAGFGQDGLLTVSVRTYETLTARVSDEAAAAYRLGNTVFLLHETHNTLPPGSPAPACAFPVEMTYRIAGLPAANYQFQHLSYDQLKVFVVALAAILGLIGLLLHRWRRRRSGAP